MADRIVTPGADDGTPPELLAPAEMHDPFEIVEALTGWLKRPDGKCERIPLPPQRINLPRFEPAPEDIPDPFEQPRWCWMQVLGWVYLRNPDVVRAASPQGNFESTLTREDLRDLGRNGACYPRLANAENAVMVELQAGQLNATGIANNKGDRKKIPSRLWPDLKFVDDPISASPKDFSRTTATVWHDPWFLRKEVLAVWPDPLESLAMADEPVAVKADRGRAANESVAKRKAPDTFVAALNDLIAEITKRAAEKGMPFDVNEMPGRKADFRALAVTFNSELFRAQSTFNDYLAGLIRFKQGARETTFYQKLFPELFQSPQSAP
jgi:hypothetical protein